MQKTYRSQQRFTGPLHSLYCTVIQSVCVCVTCAPFVRSYPGVYCKQLTGDSVLFITATCNSHKPAPCGWRHPPVPSHRIIFSSSFSRNQVIAVKAKLNYCRVSITFRSHYCAVSHLQCIFITNILYSVCWDARNVGRLKRINLSVTAGWRPALHFVSCSELVHVSLSMKIFL
jgi:hypothetical protein